MPHKLKQANSYRFSITQMISGKNEMLLWS